MAAASSSSPSPATLPLTLHFDEAAATDGGDRAAGCGVCAICLDKIALQETALVKGCDHAYCVTCILRWASYKQTPLCPQCKHPFEFLSVHRSLDGCIHDYLFEESVCLLLRAAWFEPLIVEAHEEALEEEEFYHQYQYDDDVLMRKVITLAGPQAFELVTGGGVTMGTSEAAGEKQGPVWPRMTPSMLFHLGLPRRENHWHPVLGQAQYHPGHPRRKRHQHQGLGQYPRMWQEGARRGLRSEKRQTGQLLKNI